MLCYPAGSKHQNMGTLWSERGGHGKQQYAVVFKWCSVDTKGPNCIKKISPAPLHHQQPGPVI